MLNLLQHDPETQNKKSAGGQKSGAQTSFSAICKSVPAGTKKREPLSFAEVALLSPQVIAGKDSSPGSDLCHP
jgi:hypothetical protein